MEQKKIKERTQKHLDDYARRGLRTLCIAKKVFLLLYIFKNVYSLWPAWVVSTVE